MRQLISHALVATFVFGAAAAVAASPEFPAPASAGAPPGAFEELSIEALEAAMAQGRLTSEKLVRLQLARIAALDRAGPTLRSVSKVSATALAEAKALDAERRTGRIRGPLHGITIAVKDMIDVRGMATTAGALALVDNVVANDAPAVARLRAAGAVILGKANSAEWANWRSPQTILSWSAVGGYTRNPYALNRTPSGSSSGSGPAVSAGLVTAALGTDTTGSVILPAYLTGLVGLRPTVGLIPRTGAIAFNVRADTIGPMARHVADVAVLLGVMAGSDAGDPLSADADQHKSNYVDALDANALAGIRLGVARFASIPHPPTMAVFEQALQILRAKGAILVDIDQAPPKRALEEAPQPARGHTALGEAHASYDEYLARTPPAVPVKSLADLVAFNRAHARQELFLYGQENFEKALASPPTPPTAESNARADARRQIARDQVDSLLHTYRVAALIAPSGLPATLTDVATRVSVYPPTQDTPDTLMSLSARSAYPLLTVPMGQVAGLPVGLSISGTQWSEAQLLAIGYAFEQAARARRPPTFATSIEALPEYEAAMQPQTVRGTQ